MRLTLRTLLAYLEDILEPKDREDLQQQIEASDNAGELIHRTRDVMQRIRLGAPEVLGASALDDPNTMAEYLDSTLPDGNVPDFERACLESDMMLAEAASCQRALALALGQAAQIDSDTRQRLYELPGMLADLEQARAEQAKAEAASVAPAEIADTDQSQIEVPDYLRKKGPIPWTAWLMATAALILLGMTVYLISSGPAEESVAGADSTAAQGKQVEDANKGADEGLGETDAILEDKPTVEPSKEETTAGDANASPEASSQEDINTLEGVDLAEETTAELEVTGAPESSDEPIVTESSETQPTETSAQEASETPPVEASADATQSPSTEPAEITSIGAVVNADDSLLVMELEPGDWTRVGSGEQLGLAAELLSLPTYRTVIQLANGLRLELVGLARVEAKVSSMDPRMPRVDIAYGKVILLNASEDNERDCEIDVAGTIGRVTIAPGALMCIMAQRPYTPGSDVFNESPPMEITAYAPMGSVTWMTGADRYEFGSSRQWDITPTGDITNLRNYQRDSGWIEGIRLGAWDDQASPRLPQSVPVGDEAWPRLMEVMEGNNLKEVRALAARCSAAVGHPDPLIASLSDENQNMIWRDNIRELRELASRGTIEASNVRQVMIEQNGERVGEDLFLLLRGFDADSVGRTDEELQTGALLEVFEWLESESLPVRVLATMNLEEITGRSDIFDPTDSPTRRRQTLRKIRKQLRDNDLRLSGI